MKKVKILTITLLIAVITMVAFIGVYTKVQNRMENQVKDYDLAMDLKGSRNIRLKISTGNKTIIKDAEGKEVEDSTSLTDEQITEKGYTKEEIPYNSEEAKTVENYVASQKILEKRLEKLGVSNYIIKLDDTTGDIIIELTENDRTDNVISNLYTTGKFEIVDSQTKEVLMDNKDIKQARVMYGSGNSTGTSSGTNVYLDIEFTKEGRQKLEQISSQYVKEDIPEENTQTDETTTEEENKETTEKKITMNIDDNEIMSTNFEEPIRTGKLQLSIGAASTDQKTLQGYIDQAGSMATVLDTGNMPLKYELDENQYVLTDINNQEMQIAIYVVVLVVVLALIALMVRYKVVGALGVISYIGFISLLLLVIRYANVTIAIEGLVGIVMTLILNYILVNQLTKKSEERLVVYKDFFVKIIPVIIMVVTFCFIPWTPISSFGMTMIWGIALMAIYNSILTNSLLKIGTRKEK